MTYIFAIVVLVAVGLWLFRPKPRMSREPWEGSDSVDAVDYAELEAAERELRDLDVNQKPEDGFEGDDWGPGASRR